MLPLELVALRHGLSRTAIPSGDQYQARRCVAAQLPQRPAPELSSHTEALDPGRRHWCQDHVSSSRYLDPQQCWRKSWGHGKRVCLGTCASPGVAPQSLQLPRDPALTLNERALVSLRHTIYEYIVIDKSEEEPLYPNTYIARGAVVMPLGRTTLALRGFVASMTEMALSSTNRAQWCWRQHSRVHWQQLRLFLHSHMQAPADTKYQQPCAGFTQIQHTC